MIDDLDRLEPAQAVEVLRMVRSVADFSRFRYVMCYDRDVLAHAVESGLGVQNGKLYLQKIIPLSFSLPRPESFDLRREFMAGVIRLYTSVCRTDPDETLIQELRTVTDMYGAGLKTPEFSLRLMRWPSATVASGIMSGYRTCASCSSSGQSTRIFMTGSSTISPKGPWWSPATVPSARRSRLRWSPALANTFHCSDRQKRNP